MTSYLKLMCWNVNSIKVRELNLVDCIHRHQPDVICLQELKCEDHQFPLGRFRDLGYNIEVYGQKAYNGVAVLSKFKTKIRKKGLPSFDDSQARYLEVETGGVVISSIYAPNGESLESPKFEYKMTWYRHLIDHARRLSVSQVPFIFAGDFNVAPQPILDTKIPLELQERLLCSKKEVAIIQELLNVGLIDTTRYLYPDKVCFTWWDYRSLSIQQNRGMRIDLVLAVRELAPKIIESEVDIDERHKERPSDHAPLLVTFSK